MEPKYEDRMRKFISSCILVVVAPLLHLVLPLSGRRQSGRRLWGLGLFCHRGGRHTLRTPNPAMD